MAEKALRMEMEGVMNLPPKERDLSCSQPHGHVPTMDHAVDKQKMEAPAFFSFIRM